MTLTCAGRSALGDCDKRPLYLVHQQGTKMPWKPACGLHLAQLVKRHLTANGRVEVRRAEVTSRKVDDDGS